jgi:3-phenylpropionate/trans-cinnamate dioxygenase ferredoxin subunit
VRVGIAEEKDVPEGQPMCVKVGPKTYALFKLNGSAYGLDNTCTHFGGPLSRGSLEGFVVRCPWHGSRFDVRSGQVVGPPARSPVRSYAAAVEGGKVWADFP